MKTKRKQKKALARLGQRKRVTFNTVLHIEGIWQRLLAIDARLYRLESVHTRLEKIEELCKTILASVRRLPRRKMAK